MIVLLQIVLSILVTQIYYHLVLMVGWLVVAKVEEILTN